MKAPLPPDEAQRLEALHECEVLDTPPEQLFDDFALLAAHICQTPIAMVSLVDEKRQWFKSKIGISATETSRDFAFCAHTILHKDEVLEVHDAETDPRFVDSPLVTSDPHIRFYAGAPLVTPAGHALGALCVMDRTPRSLTSEQLAALSALGRHVVAQLGIQKQARELTKEAAERQRAETKLRQQLDQVSANKQEGDRLLEMAGKSRRALLSVVEDEKRAKEELRLTHEKLRYLLEHNPAVVYTLKVEGQNVIPVIVSDSIERLLGFTGAESSRDDWWPQQLHPDDRDRALKALARGLAQGGYSEEYRIRHKDGTYRWVEDNNRVLRGPDGKPEHMVGVWTDISERRLAEEVLRKASKKAAGRKKAGIIWELAVIFALGTLVFAFMYYTDVLEGPITRLVFKFRDNLDGLLVPPAIMILGFIVFAWRRWRDAKSQINEQANIEESLRILHGELEKRIQQRTAELTGANDSLRLEIANRKKAQEELTWKTAFLEAQVDSAPDAILVVNDRNQVILQNQRLSQLFNIPDDIARTRDDEKMLQSVVNQMKDQKQFLERVTHLYAHPEAIGRDEIELASGAILDRYSAPVRDKSGKYYGRIWTFRDISEQRKLEAQFRQSQKMEGIGQLAGGVAHDFNNILAVIQMQAGLLKESDGLSADQSEFADEISATVQRAASLTRQLLLFSRREVFQPRDLDLSESISNTIKMLRRILGENIKMELKLASQPMLIHADAGMMDQVLLNLVVNARDAMPQGGRLIIETSGVKFDELAVSQSEQMRTALFVCLSVTDSGCGIPPEILPKIFEPFFTTKGVGKGTGLGLATVYGIVQQHQGWVNVYSEPDRGTTFRIYLPRVSPNTDPKSSSTALTAVPGGNETILLVEDDPALRTSVRKALSHLGYRILEAPTGVKALEVWRENSTEIHLLLTDLVMPDGMTGKDLGQRVPEENPKMKVIYASGYSVEVAGKDLSLEEGVNFLSKPFEAHKLAKIVHDCLDKN